MMESEVKGVDVEKEAGVEQQEVKKGKKGRPFKLKKADLLKAIKGYNGNRGLMIKALKIAPRTFDSYLERYPDIKTAYLNEVDKRRTALVQMAESAMWNHVNNGYWPAVRFALATQGGFVEQHKLQHTGKDGETLRFVPFEKVVDDSPISSSDDE